MSSRQVVTGQKKQVKQVSHFRVSLMRQEVVLNRISWKDALNCPAAILLLEDLKRHGQGSRNRN